MDNVRKTQPDQLAEELRFEYSHLNEQIDHNENHINEILGAVVLLVSALITVSFNGTFQNQLLRLLLYFFAQIIAGLGFRQTFERERGTFMIASYLRTFIEPELPGLKWETRLEKFRSRFQKTTKRTYYINYRLFTYPFLIFLNSLFISAFLIYYILSKIITTNIAVIVTVLTVLDWAGALWFVWTEWMSFREITINHAKNFDPRWLEIKQEESKGVKRSR